MIGDCERIAILAIPKQELDLAVGAPGSLGVWPRDNAVPCTRRRLLEQIFGQMAAIARQQK